MFKLMKLELRRINLRTYHITTLMLGGLLFISIYFIAHAAQVTNEAEFMTYGNILIFTCVISMLLFGVLSATMYNNLVIKEYSGKRVTLLFSYPANRKKIFMAKVFIIFSLIFLSMTLCTLVPIVVFSITETFTPIVSDTITPRLLLSTLSTVFISVLFTSTIGILSMGFGFIKKSVTVTLISAFILSAILGNIAISINGNLILSLFVIAISIFVCGLVLMALSNKINNMEVD